MFRAYTRRHTRWRVFLDSRRKKKEKKRNIDSNRFDSTRLLIWKRGTDRISTFLLVYFISSSAKSYASAIVPNTFVPSIFWLADGTRIRIIFIWSFTVPFQNRISPRLIIPIAIERLPAGKLRRGRISEVERKMKKKGNSAEESAPIQRSRWFKELSRRRNLNKLVRTLTILLNGTIIVILVIIRIIHTYQ